MHRYHQIDNNCYSFVIRFLNEIRYAGSKDHTKEEVVEKFIGEWLPPLSLLLYPFLSLLSFHLLPPFSYLLNKICYAGSKDHMSEEVVEKVIGEWLPPFSLLSPSFLLLPSPFSPSFLPPSSIDPISYPI
jgi:hypothetical protein